MFVPGLSDVLGIEPVPLLRWLGVAAVAASLILVMEVYKGLTARAATGDIGPAPLRRP
jgi:hypothetical protein